MTSAIPTRRLPGIRFEPEPPAAATVLPRMDVAGLVGFASAGPLHVPVPIDNPDRFAAIFGDDPPLCRDPGTGETLHGHLGAAVRAFFDGGGRRCWAVRAAGRRAARSRVPIPGLAQAPPGGPLEPAELPARSAGSWGDGLRVRAALSVEPLDARLMAGDGELRIEVTAAPDRLPRRGDVLRLAFVDDLTLVCAVAGEARPAESSPPGAAVAQLGIGRRVWLRAEHGTAALAGEATFLDPRGRRRQVPAGIARRLVPELPDDERRAALALPPALDLGVEPAAAPPPGTVVRLDASPAELWLVVDERSPAPSLAPDPSLPTRVAAIAQRLEAESAAGAPALALERAERLKLTLSARSSGAEPALLADLGLAAEDPRFLGGLPSDEELFGSPKEEWRELWQAADEPRFPLCGRAEDSGLAGRPESFYADASPPAEAVPPELFVPLSLPAGGGPELGARHGSGADRERDGLEPLDTGAFLDDALAGTSSARLLQEAAFVGRESERPRPLRGIHALLETEEVTLIAAPDAVHEGWDPKAPEPHPAPEPSPPPLRPEWWRCPRPESIEALGQAPWHRFLDCAADPPAVPAWAAGSPWTDAAGSVLLAWEPVAGDGVEYALEEAGEPDWRDAVAVYRGPDTRLELHGRAPGAYYYRVRAEVAGRVGDWSEGKLVEAGEASGWQRREPGRRGAAPTLLPVHAALLRLGAARGDLLAVLSLPEGSDEDAAIAHRGELIEELAGDERALGFGALYHPWLTAAEPGGGLRRVPPDGAVLGTFARRASERGAWVAPANEDLRDVVALTRPAAEGRLLALLEGQVNAIRSEPGGFRCLSADTLAADPEVRPVNVRRLLMLLRRLALLHGPRYAFEPNDAVLRRRVQRGFEALLGRLFQLGAFAGTRAEQAYRVEVSRDRRRRDRGELEIELKVAPARPLSFLSLRLLHRGEHGLVVEAAR